MWDVMHKNFRIAPGWCPLCKDNNDSVEHPFIMFTYINKMMEFVAQVSGVQFLWMGQNLGESLQSQINNVTFKEYKALPNILIWGSWISKNGVIFNEVYISPKMHYTKGLDILSHFPRHQENCGGGY